MNSKKYFMPVLLFLIFYQLGIQLAIATSSDSIAENSEYSTLTDIDGNMYETIKIGDQWWINRLPLG